LHHHYAACFKTIHKTDAFVPDHQLTVLEQKSCGENINVNPFLILCGTKSLYFSIETANFFAFRGKHTGEWQVTRRDFTLLRTILAWCERFQRDANDFSVSHETNWLPGNKMHVVRLKKFSLQKLAFSVFPKQVNAYFSGTKWTPSPEKSEHRLCTPSPLPKERVRAPVIFSVRPSIVRRALGNSEGHPLLCPPLNN
jgi:hypothetical protein